MKFIKIFIIMVGFTALLFTGCNPNLIDVDDESAKGVGVVVSPDEGIDFEIPAATRSGADWIGWYSACASYSGYTKIFVNSFYSSPYHYVVIYMCDDNYQWYYYVYYRTIYEDVPYTNFQFDYGFDGDIYTVKFYIYSGVKKVRITNNTQGYWTNYTKD